MSEDPVVAEVRRIREEYAAKFNFDLRAMCEALRRKSEKEGPATVSRPPRPVKPATTTRKAG